jgi:polar amino acid transport system substrate-binding protein
MRLSIARALLVSLSLSACGAERPEGDAGARATDPELAFPPESAPEFLLVTESYPPYEYLDEAGKADGPDVAIIEEAARRAGVRVRFLFIPWARAELMAQAGSADGIFSCTRTAARETFLIYPEHPLAVELNAIIAAPSYSGGAVDLAGIAGEAVGHVEGNVFGGGFDEATAIDKRPVADQAALAALLIDGRVSLVANNLLVAESVLKGTPLEGKLRLLFPLSELKLYLAFSRASPRGAMLHRLLAPILADMEASGAAERIRKSYRR